MSKLVISTGTKLKLEINVWIKISFIFVCFCIKTQLIENQISILLCQK